jgi:hypothetical protein
MMRSITVVERREIRPPPRFALHNLSLRIIRDGSEDVHLELPSGRRGVDPFGQGHKGHPECLQFVEQRNQMFQAAPQAIEAPAHENRSEGDALERPATDRPGSRALEKSSLSSCGHPIAPQ